MNRSNPHARNSRAGSMTRAFSVCLVFALLGSACGDDDGNAPAALDEDAGSRSDAGDGKDSGPAPAPIRDAMADAAPPVMTGIFPDRPEQPPPMMVDAAALEPKPVPEENVVGGGAAGTSSDASVPAEPDAPDASSIPEHEAGVDPGEQIDASTPPSDDPPEPDVEAGVVVVDAGTDPVDAAPPIVNECVGDCDCVGTACECNGESHCVASCDPALGCDLSCSGPLPCTMQCNDNCFAECEGEMGCSVVLGPEGSARCGDGGDCSYICEGSCSVACEVGSSCVLSCINPEADCPMDCGDSFAVDCGGGVYACREACPLSEGGTSSEPIIDSGSSAVLDGGD